MKFLSVCGYIKNVYTSWKWTDEEVQKYENLIREWGQLEIRAAHEKIAEPIPENIKNKIEEVRSKIRSLKKTVWKRRKEALFPKKQEH